MLTFFFILYLLQLKLYELSAECCTLIPIAVRQRAKFHTARRQDSAAVHSSFLKNSTDLRPGPWSLDTMSVHNQLWFMQPQAAWAIRVFRGSWLCWQCLLKAFAKGENQKTFQKTLHTHESVSSVQLDFCLWLKTSFGLRHSQRCKFNEIATLCSIKKVVTKMNEILIWKQSKLHGYAVDITVTWFNSMFSLCD